MVNKNGTQIDAANLIIHPDKISDVFPAGTVVMMIPSAIKSKFIPVPVKLNNVTPGCSIRN